MFRIVRAVVLAVVIAVSLLGSASIASANTIGVKVPAPLPTPPHKLPAQLFDITWE